MATEETGSTETPPAESTPPPATDAATEAKEAAEEAKGAAGEATGARDEVVTLLRSIDSKLTPAAKVEESKPETKAEPATSTEGTGSTGDVAPRTRRRRFNELWRPKS